MNCADINLDVDLESMKHLCNSCDLNQSYKTHSIFTIRPPKVLPLSSRDNQSVRKEIELKDLINDAEDLTFVWESKNPLICVAHIKKENFNKPKNIRGSCIRSEQKSKHSIGTLDKPIVYKNMLVKIFGKGLAHNLIELEDQKRSAVISRLKPRFYICDNCYEYYLSFLELD